MRRRGKKDKKDKQSYRRLDWSIEVSGAGHYQRKYKSWHRRYRCGKKEASSRPPDIRWPHSQSITCLFRQSFLPFTPTIKHVAAARHGCAPSGQPQATAGTTTSAGCEANNMLFHHNWPQWPFPGVFCSMPTY
jgi:hypothetical protein